MFGIYLIDQLRTQQLSSCPSQGNWISVGTVTLSALVVRKIFHVKPVEGLPLLSYFQAARWMVSFFPFFFFVSSTHLFYVAVVIFSQQPTTSMLFQITEFSSAGELVTLDCLRSKDFSEDFATQILGELQTLKA
jgi:hypothetical protein